MCAAFLGTHETIIFVHMQGTHIVIRFFEPWLISVCILIEIVKYTPITFVYCCLGEGGECFVCVLSLFKDSSVARFCDLLSSIRGRKFCRLLFTAH